MVGVSKSVAATLMFVAALAATLAGCSTAPSPEHEQAADAYEAVLRWVLADEPPGPDGMPAPVFVEPLAYEHIDLEVQVALIERLTEYEKLRFIDDREEAIDLELVDAPVRDAGVLIALGVVADESPTTVRVEVYRDRNDIAAYRLPMTRSGSSWTIDGEPEMVAAEDLTVDPDRD